MGHRALDRSVLSWSSDCYEVKTVPENGGVDWSGFAAEAAPMG